MHAAIRTFDSMLNRFTMYKVVAWGLTALNLIAIVCAATGLIAVSAWGIAASLLTLGLGCFVANKLFARLFRAAPNAESWLISAAIMALLFPPSTSLSRLGLLVVASVIAMGSKYILVWRGTHIFNPAALAAFVLSVSGLLPATWWVANPTLIWFSAVLAVLVLRKIRRFSLFFTFAGAALITMLFVSSGLHGQPVGDTLRNALLSWPIVFFGSIMLTEPTTLPATRSYQAMFGVLVGVLFSGQFHIGSVTASPQLALLVGNLFTLTVAPSFGGTLRLTQLTKLSDDIYEAIFAKPKGFTFTPGQYMEWTLPHKRTDIRGNRRTFSIASSPTEPDLRIAFRHYERSSSFKDALVALKPGEYIRAAHVAGSFILPADQKTPLLFIAGGIGITPFRSMAKYLADTNQQRDVILLYFVSKEEDLIYRDATVAAHNVGLKTRYITARPDISTITSMVPDIADRTVYISGPDLLVTACKDMVVALGAPRSHIHTDHFAGY